MIVLFFLGCFQVDTPDDDGDGFTRCDVIMPDESVEMACEMPDCDDENAEVFPGAQPVCDGTDHDCDGVPDYLAPNADCDRDGILRDADEDGYSPMIDDCDDRNSVRFPGSIEWCADGIDNDCDNVVDENACEVL